MEMTQAFSRLGSQVTVFERGDRPVRLADPEASEVLRQVLEDEGVRFRFGADVTRVHRHSGTVVITDRGQEIEGDALLVAVGGRPTVEGLDLERAGVTYSQPRIEVDEHLPTRREHIYSCRGVSGRLSGSPPP